MLFKNKDGFTPQLLPVDSRYRRTQHYYGCKSTASEYTDGQSAPIKYPPHNYIILMNQWYEAGWINAFMLFTLNSDPTLWMSQQNMRLIRPAEFFSILQLSNFGELFLVDRSSTGCSLLLLEPSASRFNALCIHKCSSAYVQCNKWSF